MANTKLDFFLSPKSPSVISVIPFNWLYFHSVALTDEE